MRTLIVISIAAVAFAAQDVPRTRGGTTENPPANRSRNPATPGEVPVRLQNRQKLDVPEKSQLPSSRGISVTAKLIEPEKEAVEKAAVVQVNVGGLKLVDPDASGRKARPGEGHLLYRMDGGPVIATTATKLGFRQLSAGAHRIDITVAANDDTPLGPHRMVDVKIP